MCSGISAILHGRIGTDPGSITDARSMTGRDTSSAGNPPRIMSSVARRITGAPKRRDREVRNGKDTEGAHRGGNPSSSGSRGLERSHEAKVTSSDDSK